MDMSMRVRLRILVINSKPGALSLEFRSSCVDNIILITILDTRMLVSG